MGASLVLGLVVTATGLLIDLFPDLKPEPSTTSEVTVDSVAVGRIEELHGQTRITPEAEKVKKVYDAPVIDVLLGNSGEEPASVTSARFDFFAVTHMLRCSRAGGGAIDYVRFPVAVPVDAKENGHRIVQAMRFGVGPGEARSVAFALGPKTDSYSPAWVYGFSLTLTAGTSEVVIPKAAVTDVDRWEKDVLEGAAASAADPDSSELQRQTHACYTDLLKTTERIAEEAEHLPPGWQEFAITFRAVMEE
ncbi:hypothetical protein [Streptomyces sp. SP18CS02]|uniref:hypothetical protein n=1 Tax=Streptomyces sp. SP18CS02 TaxID=3002531 RepID=UPI002E78C8CD|nr:hypothetical protein [Streptomyces sp. SP18CS02]MEE1752209.1 hypothetical protein [Streptomyces sp. SP18CS02]